LSWRGRKPKQRLPAFFEEYADKLNKKVFVCPFCGYQSMKKSDLNKHLTGHTQPVEIPIYACAECTYTTRRKCDMSKHLLTHCENDTGKNLYLYISTRFRKKKRLKSKIIFLKKAYKSVKKPKSLSQMQDFFI